MTDKTKEEATTTILSESIENTEELGMGNNTYLSFYGNSSQMNKVTAELVAEEETTRTEPQAVETVGEIGDGTTEGNMVMHKGALIDVAKLLQQLNRSEKAREETEIRLTEVTRTHNELLSSNSKAKDKIKDLQSELKSCSRRVSDAESSFNSTNVRRSIIYLTVVVQK